MWSRHKLTLDFETALCGGMPRSDKIVEGWLRARAPTEAGLKRLQQGIGPDGRKPRDLDAVAAEAVGLLDPIPEETEEKAEKMWVGFARDKTGLFVRGGSVRAHLKDCASVIAPAMKRGDIPGLKQILNFRAKFVDAVYVAEDRVYIRCPDTTEVIKEPTGYRDATMTVMTARGPRTCLKRVDFIEPAWLIATVQLYEHGEIGPEHLRACLEYGGVHGFGQDRSLQYGRYHWKLEEET